MTHAHPRAMPNALIGETSPYLLQHAYNPVRWMPWGAEAFELARRGDKPIFLSIGYAACHWCHVMERESFEDEAIAALLNAHFVSIKVDREERPDVDAHYMQAAQIVAGAGGWPLSVFLTPEGRPFFAGTYFPPRPRYGRIGFLQLLERIRELWERDRSGIEQSGRELARLLAREGPPVPSDGQLGWDLLERAADDLARQFDARDGGFGGAPKFPPSMALTLLLDERARRADPTLGPMVERTLDAMARGGLHDQIGGGFHRYSTDAHWFAPHFEKMLYDNALLARVYFDAAAALGQPAFERVGRRTLDYLLRDMAHPEGGFYSSQDADSEGEEGKYYLWTPSEIVAVLGEADAELACAYWDIVEGGNWPEGAGGSIPHVPQPLDAFARARGLDPGEFEARVEHWRERLLAARRRRVPPATDDKILAGWNGLAIGALARGAQATGDVRYLDAACRAAGFVLGHLRAPDGSLLRSWRAGRAHVNAVLEDYAFLIGGLIDLYETTFAACWLAEADRLAATMLDRFAAPGGGFYTADGSDPLLPSRGMDFFDGATPSGNSAAAHALLRLHALLDRPPYEAAARAAIEAAAGAMRRMPGAFHEMIRAAGRLLAGPTEVAVVAPPPDVAGETAARARALIETAWRTYAPYRALAASGEALGGLWPELRAPAPEVLVRADSAPPGVRLLEGRRPHGGRPTAWVCRNRVCSPPIDDPDTLRAALRETGSR